MGCNHSDIDNAYRAFGFLEGMLENQAMSKELRTKISNNLENLLYLMNAGVYYIRLDEQKSKK